MDNQAQTMLDKIPLDVFSIIMRRLDIEDSLSLLQTSSALYFTRHLWLICLEAAINSRPLPCPPDQDFRVLHFAALRHIACTASRLERNWSLDKPRCIHVKQVKTETQQHPVAYVPGYPVVVVWSEPGRLQCWNVKTGVCFGTIEGVYSFDTLPGDVIPPCVSAPYIDQGKMTFVVFSCHSIDASSPQLVVVSIDYTVDPMGFAEHFRVAWNYEQVANNLRFGWPSGLDIKLVMSSPSSGFGVFNGSLCFAFSKEKEQITSLILDLPDNFENVKTLYVRNGYLHIHYQLETSNDDPAPVLVTASALTGNSSAGPKATLTSDGAYKSCHYRLPFFDHWFVWNKSDTSYTMTLNFGTPPRAEKLLSFTKSSKPSIILGHDSDSGLYALFGFKGTKTLSLFRFRHLNDPPTCTEHFLSLPGSVRIPDEYAINQLGRCVLLDEHLGILYVCDREAISACYYA